MSRCVILSAGPAPDVSALRDLLRVDDHFIAADGGWRLAQRLGVEPELLIADFDSLDRETMANPVPFLNLPTHKDVTDTQAAVDAAYDRGYRDFLLLGCTGGRLDHQHAALITAVNLARRGCRVVLADGRNRIAVYISSPGELPPVPGYKVSFFAFGEPVKGLTLKNVAYPLTDYTLTPYDPLCVSNEFTESSATITFRSGILLAYYSKD